MEPLKSNGTGVKNLMISRLLFKMSLPGVILAALIGVQCAGTGFGPDGSIFASATVGVHAAPEGSLTGSKTGKSCVASYLGWIAVGDASMATVTQDAGITAVKTIDMETFSILGLYSELCTVVTGD